MPEIIDVNKRTVVSSARLHGFSRYIIDDRHIATCSEEDDGTPIMHIYRFDARHSAHFVSGVTRGDVSLGSPHAPAPASPSDRPRRRPVAHR